MRSILLISGLFFLNVSSIFSQDLTGIWRGHFTTDDGEQYRYEVQIEQKKTGLSGVTYSYLDKRFYGKATFSGNFNKLSRNALVQEIRTVEVRMSESSFSCIQKCLLTYVKSGAEEWLEGSFTSIIEKTDTIYGVIRGTDCGGGTMVLRRVPTSDFYVEPFLRNRKTPNAIVKDNTSKPAQPKTTTQNKTTTNTKPTTTTKVPVVTRPKNDPVGKIKTETEKEKAKVSTNKVPISIPPVLKSRENNLLQTITVNTEEVIVKLYDNGEIDDDTISVYLNNKLVLSKKRLTASALTIKLKMDEDDSDHELVMVAENLGRIPPNTSLMVVTAGEKRFEVRITSTEQKNAVVRFRYVKPATP